MVWQYPDADTKWIHAVRMKAFPVGGGLGLSTGVAAANTVHAPGVAPGAPGRSHARKHSAPKALGAPPTPPGSPRRRRTVSRENFGRVY